jgi:hypothetical protein
VRQLAEQVSGEAEIRQRVAARQREWMKEERETLCRQMENVDDSWTENWERGSPLVQGAAEARSEIYEMLSGFESC